MKKIITFALSFFTLVSMSACDVSLGDDTTLFVRNQEAVLRKSYTNNYGIEQNTEYGSDAETIYYLNFYVFNDSSAEFNLEASNLKLKINEEFYPAKQYFKRFTKGNETTENVDENTTKTTTTIGLGEASESYTIKANSKTDELCKFTFELKDAPKEFEVYYKDTLLKNMPTSYGEKFYKDDTYKVDEANKIYIALEQETFFKFNTRKIGTEIVTKKTINETKDEKIYYTVRLELGIYDEDTLNVEADDLSIKINDQFLKGNKFINQTTSMYSNGNITITEVKQNEVSAITIENAKISEVYLTFKNNSKEISGDFSVYYKDVKLPIVEK